MDPAIMKLPPHWLNEAPIGDPSQDLLGFGVPARRIAAHLRSAHPSSSRGGDRPHSRGSLVLTIEGSWGEGKTSFSNLVLHELRNRRERWRSPVEVNFSAWQSVTMGLTPWEALCYRLGEAFYSRFHRLCLRLAQQVEPGSRLKIGHPRFKARDPERSRGEPGAVLEVDLSDARAGRWFGEARLHWLEVAYRLSESIGPEDWDPCLKLFTDAPSKVPGRGLGLREGIETLVDLGSGGLRLAAADAGGAVDAVASSVRGLLRHRLAEGPGWGVDTQEFARDLNRLLYVLHPEPRDWRAVIVVDDTTRLPEQELPRVLEALAYLRELEDVLVLLNLHPRVVEQLRQLRHESRSSNEGRSREGTGAKKRGAGGEDFLSRLVHVRFPIPRPTEAELSRMMAHSIEDLEIPPITVVSPVLRHFLSEREVTPRQMKRALQWLWFRLGPSDHGEPVLCKGCLEAANPATLENLLILLLDLHLYGEGRKDGEGIVQRLLERRELLLCLSVQPWDLRPWLDGHGCSREIWTDFPQALALLAAMRLQALIFHCDTSSAEPGFYLGREAWKAWREEMGHRDWLKLAEAADLEEPAAFFEHLVNLPTRTGGRVARIQLQLATQMASAARYYHFAEDAPIIRNGNFAQAPNLWYFDPDTLLRLATDPEIEAPWAAKAWILLSFVTPKLAQLYGKVLMQSPRVRALVPEAALELRNQLAAEEAPPPAGKKRS